MKQSTAAKLVSVTIIIGAMYLLQGVLVPLLFASLISVILCPLTVFLEKKKVPSILAAALTVLIAFIVISGIVWFIVNQVIIIGSIDYQFQEKYTEIISALENFFMTRFNLQPTDVWEWIKEQSQDLINSVTGYVSVLFSSAGNTVANFVLMPLYIFFMLYYRDFFVAFFYRAFPNTPEDKVSNTLNRIYYVIQSYILGLVTVMGIVAVLNTIGLWVMNIQYAWFFGVLAALLLLIPYIGIAIGSILPAVFALVTMDSGWYAVGVLVWFQVVQFFEGNFITPNIVGGKVSVNPMFAIISLLLGSMLFGLPGLILAMPMMAVLKVAMDASPEWSAFGFVIGEPEKQYLHKKSKNRRKRKWRIPSQYRNRK
ncbi:AI-2E family transporter [Membranihabitans marinus]|uniref:AI-2E family transporter n=1 Tax=Membranihabitans marinus TaxID=1227546 RepID=UPI001F37F819|nr:AI-2E family transporter [Membranihabitans marinus]